MSIEIVSATVVGTQVEVSIKDGPRVAAGILLARRPLKRKKSCATCGRVIAAGAQAYADVTEATPWKNERWCERCMSVLIRRQGA